MIESFWAFIQEQQSVTTTSYSIVVIRTTLGIGYYDYNILCFRTYDNIYFKIGLLTVSLSVYQVVKVKQISFYRTQYLNSEQAIRNIIDLKIISKIKIFEAPFY